MDGTERKSRFQVIDGGGLGQSGTLVCLRVA